MGQIEETGSGVLVEKEVPEIGCRGDAVHFVFYQGSYLLTDSGKVFHQYLFCDRADDW